MKKVLIIGIVASIAYIMIKQRELSGYEHNQFDGIFDWWNKLFVKWKRPKLYNVTAGARG